MTRKRPAPTAAQTRRANRGNVPGVLGMEELAMLSGRPDTVSNPVCRLCDGSGKRMTHPAGAVEACFACSNNIVKP